MEVVSKIRIILLCTCIKVFRILLLSSGNKIRRTEGRELSPLLAKGETIEGPLSKKGFVRTGYFDFTPGTNHRRRQPDKTTYLT